MNILYLNIIPIPTWFFQVMVAWWFGLVVWKSGKSDVTAKKKIEKWAKLVT